MTDEPLLELSGVWKKYSKTYEASLKYGLRDAMGETINRRASEELRNGEFWSLKDVSFTVNRGDAVGLMGRNGAGKSTLLKIISGIISPDRGSIRVRGHVEQMIEMAGGFKKELTGRENIAIRAKLLGIPKKQLKNVIEDVVEFTELAEFIDSPVAFYSSGMKSRLGFALATLLTPDLLIVDEALAVGDLPFRLKCYERLSKMLETSALLLVSHTTGNVKRFCNRGGYLKKGELDYFGDLQTAIRSYQDEFVVSKNARTAWNEDLLPVRWTTDGVELENPHPIPVGGDLTVEIDTSRLPEDTFVYVRLRVPDGSFLCEWNSDRASVNIRDAGKFKVQLGPLQLSPNYYAVNVEAMRRDGELVALVPPQQIKVVGDYVNDVPLHPIGNWIPV